MAPRGSRSTRPGARLLFFSLLLPAFSLGGCGDDDGPADAEPDSYVALDVPAPLDASLDGVETDAPGVDAGADVSPADVGSLDVGSPDVGSDVPDAGPAAVAVSHERALRATWVSTVFRLDFPSATGLSEAQARAELGAIVDDAADSGMNAIYFQVRPEGDAAYTSTLEPWSRFLSGTQGVAPGYDPLAILLELAHPRGLEVHAWLNPFRGSTSSALGNDPLSPVSRFPEAAVVYNGQIVMNPASEAVRDHTLAVITDIATRFDIDGVVFDDYFYPYPDSDGTPFPDSAEYNAYVSAGGTLIRSNWRRANINALISAVGPTLRGIKPWLRWGVAPFGIYRPGIPDGIVGLDAYETLSADSLRWMSEEWVDYISPQLYWTSTSTGQPFGPLVEWWAGVASPERPVIPAMGLYRFGLPEWTVEEFETQVALTRGHAPSSAGESWFRHQMVGDPRLSELFARIYALPARPPALPDRGEPVAMPTARPNGTGLDISAVDAVEVSGFAIYSLQGTDWVFERWQAGGGAAAVALPAGSYAVTAISRSGVESLGIRSDVP